MSSKGYLCLGGLWAMCAFACWRVAATYPTELSMSTAHLRPSLAGLWTGLLLLALGVTVFNCSDTLAKKCLCACVALAGGLLLVQLSRSYGCFEETISYRSPLSFERVVLQYQDLEMVEVQWARRRRLHSRLYQVVLHFRGGRLWRSAVDGMLEGEDNVRLFLSVIRLHAPTVRLVERVLS